MTFSQPGPDRANPRLFLGIYALAIAVIYSAIPYKTPWLALNFWLPLAILAGFGGEWLWQKTMAIRGLFWIAAAGLGLLLATDTWQRTFANPRR